MLTRTAKANAEKPFIVQFSCSIFDAAEVCWVPRFSGPKPGPKVAAKATAPEGVHHALDAAFEFIHKVGGVFHAEQLIAKLKSLKEKL